MGWTILYIAFGVVALWLLGEVLLQYKARLRWRILAFVGFLGVVLGVILSSVVVIALGAIGFAIGQTYVTLSFRRGFSMGWALDLGGKFGTSRRDEDDDEAAYDQDAAVYGDAAYGGTAYGAAAHGDAARDAATYGDEAHPGAVPPPPAVPPSPAAAFEGAEYGHPPAEDYGPQHTYQTADAFPQHAVYHDGYADAPGPYGDGPGHDDLRQPAYATGPTAYLDTQAMPVFAPEPLPDETGTYGVYSPDARPQPHQHEYGAYDTYGGGPDQSAAQPYADGYGTYAEQPGAQTGYSAEYQGYGTPADTSAYADPYYGTQYGAQYEQYDQYAATDPYGPPAHGYDDGQYAGQYAGQYYGAPGYPEGYDPTSPGGVWVPQQRAGDYPPDQQQYAAEHPPHQQHQQPGYDEQHYRY